MRSTLVLSLLASSLLTTGCAVETVTTEIQLRDPTHAALVRKDATGTQRVPLPRDATIMLVGEARHSLTPESPTSIAHWCTMASREPRGQKLRYEVALDPKCVESPTLGSIGFELDADWDDVRVVEHHRPDRAGAWAIVGLSTLLYGALAATVFLAPHIRGGPAVRYGLGATTAGIGAAFDLAMLPTIVAPDTDIVIHDFGLTAPVAESVPIVIQLDHRR